MPAIDLYNSLVKNGIKNSTGHAYFSLSNVTTKINDNSVFGNLIQEWLIEYMKTKKIYFRDHDNAQEPPDFFLDPKSHTKGLLEVKCFTKSPNFDIANFQSYIKSLLDKPYRLDSDYLIFEYINNNGAILIKDFWLKKVWEISGSSERAAINLQWKQNIIYNIRPRNWTTKNPRFPIFNSRLEFVQALAIVVNTNAQDPTIQKNWFKRIEEAYYKNTGSQL
ncbi:MAG: NgoBV family restriction endonuclease [Brevinema sp.]